MVYLHEWMKYVYAVVIFYLDYFLLVQWNHFHLVADCYLNRQMTPSCYLMILHFPIEKKSFHQRTSCFDRQYSTHGYLTNCYHVDLTMNLNLDLNLQPFASAHLSLLNHFAIQYYNSLRMMILGLKQYLVGFQTGSSLSKCNFQ